MNISALVTRYLFVFTFFLAIPVKAEENILNANYNFSPSDHIEIKMGELEKQFANLTNEIERLKYELSMLQQKQNQINADVSLHFSDYRAIERTFQLITQVAGRAGRSDKEGKVVLQTYFPRHFAYRYASTYDYNAFYKREINLREVTKFPPFVSMLRVLVISQDSSKAELALKKLYDEIVKLKEIYTSDFVYLYPMKCPKKRIQGNYRYQIMIRINKKNAPIIIPKIYDICDSNKANKVSIFVENEPQNLSWFRKVIAFKLLKLVLFIIIISFFNK